MGRFVNTATEIHSAFRGELVSLLRAVALRSLTDALLPAGVSVYFLRYVAALLV